MPKFEVEHIAEFNTRQRVNKLIRDGKCMFDAFITDIRSDYNLEPELGDLFAVIRYVAEGTTPFLPKKKFRKLKLSTKLKYAGFEAKSKHLRLYLFMEKSSGMILAFGGSKGTQEQTDLQLLEKIIKEYSQSQ